VPRRAGSVAGALAAILAVFVLVVVLVVVGEPQVGHLAQQVHVIRRQGLVLLGALDEGGGPLRGRLTLDRILAVSDERGRIEALHPFL